MEPELLNKIPILPQRQDSVAGQLSDIIMVANRMGMYDAADTIQRMAENLPVPEWGCHCDLEPHMEPDACVIDTKGFHLCVYAKKGMRKEQCEYWQKIK